MIVILTIGMSLAGLMFTGQRVLRAEIQTVRTELREGLAAAAAERAVIRNDIHALAERVARLEGAVPFLMPRPLPAPEKPEPQPSA